MGKQVTATRTSSDAGYFRIGNLILDIPPEQIQCHKVINNEEVLPLRFPFAIPVKTGQSRWDVTWTWKAVQDTSADNPFKAWEDVQLLLAMMKAAPFVEVENAHIRQMVNPSALTHGATADDTMAFALRQMRVDTVPDLSDTIQITMTMSLFNYRPYSSNFQYDSGSNRPVANALNSPIFDSYLQKWIQVNLHDDPTQQPSTGDAVTSTDWKSIAPGTIVFSAREYVAAGLPHDLPIPQGQPNPKAANPGANKPGAAAQGGQSNFVDNVFVDNIAVSNPQIGWWITAVSGPESNGNYSAINLKTQTNLGKPSAAVGLLQWTRDAAIDSMVASDKLLGSSYISTALQAGSLVSANRRSSSYTWGLKTVPNPRSSDAVVSTFIDWMLNPPISGGATKLQSDMAIAWAILKLKANGGSVLRAWEAHRFGQGIVNSGQNNDQSDNKWFTATVNSWRGSSQNPQTFAPSQSITAAGAPQGTAQGTVVTSGTNTNTKPNVSNATNPPDSVPMTSMIRYFLHNGYTYDYATEAAAFLYKEHWLKITDQDPVHGDFADSSDIQDIDPDHFVYTNQISVIFVNNIAQLPLAGYQYPTYQHLGPVSTLVSVGLLSNADIPPATDDYDEPNHTGLSFLSSMTNMLEDQFQRLRNEWRRVNSIHRMQSLAVKNQVLNMLGIRGLLTKELTTETIPESPSMVTAQYNAVQYENVYKEEAPSPFKVTVVPAQVGKEWLTVLRDGSLNQFKGDQSLGVLTNLSSLMQDPKSVVSGKFLFDWLTTAQPSPRTEAYLVPTPTPFQGSEQQLMLKVLDEGGQQVIDIESGATAGFPTFSEFFPDISKSIKTHSQLNYSDFHLILYGINQDVPDFQAFQTMARAVNERIDLALAANPSFEPPINQLFDEYVDYAVSNNVLLLRDQMVRALNTPQLKGRFVTADSTSVPGSISVNNTHGCYLDMGIREVELGGRDYTPAVYFYDDNKALTNVLQSQVEQAVDSTVKTSQIFAQATPYANKTNLIDSKTESFSGNVSGILQNVKPSQYTMAKAFPTFKLFLMEDHSDRPFYAYDNFYSYASVVDLEIQRYRNLPDTAVIQISNLMHLLDQHLYDATPQGRFEQRLRANTEVALPAGEALTGGNNAVGAVKVNDAPGGEIFSLDNRFTQINPSGGGDQKFPLKYFALQTGTKIQIRMGFSNNPDLLVPVFTGQITQIEGNEMLTITAQSYMLELVNPTPDEISHDGFAVDSFLSNTANAGFKAIRDFTNGNLLRIPTSLLSVFSNSAAYGGWGTVGGIRIPGILTTGGGVKDVMSQMLKVSSAKHFGAWQFGAPQDPYVKGYSWQSARASAMILAINSPLVRGATGLEAGYDRSFENILTTHVFGSDGMATDDSHGSARTWWFEKPAGYGSPEYHVPKDPTLTPWTLIQDIARRFPEFILTVKQYGFPFTADATLVFANPHDFYATRPPMPKEIEVQQQAATDDKQFLPWWFLGTNSGRQQFISFCRSFGGPWANTVLTNYDASIGFKGDVATSKLGQLGTVIGMFGEGSGVTNMRDITADELSAHIDGGGSTVFFTVIDQFVKVIGSASVNGLLAGAQNVPGHGISPNQALENLNQLVQNYHNRVNQKLTGSETNVALNARMKPVRRYHLINVDNIIHNGISLNEKFYNTVRLGKEQLKANAAIPPQYCRVLNADPYIVSQDNITGDPPISKGYIQSFLRDEIAKMYRGELVLLGNPEIEPFDILMIMDPSTGISGPIEVDQVFQSFNQETGYITIVKPRSFVIINDKLSAPLYLAVWKMLTDVQGMIEGQASKLPFAYIPGQGLLSGSQLAHGAELAVGALAVAGGIAAGPWIAGAAAAAGAIALFWTGNEIQGTNPLGLAPLTRFERPWVGGLEGWRIDDLMGFLATKWNYFKTEEIEPLIFSYRTARGMQII